MASKNDAVDARRPLLGKSRYDDVDGLPTSAPSTSGTRQNSNSLAEVDSLKSEEATYHVYSRRWFIIIVAALLNASNAAIWITFSPIADLTAKFYAVSLGDVNWLSLVYLAVFVPFGLCSAWIVDTLGLRISIVLGSWLNALGAVLRVVSAIESIPINPSFAILMTGQGLAAAAQPIAMIIPVKVAALWFGADQRAIANTIGTMANPLGIMISNFVSPNLLDDDITRMIWLLLAMAIIPVLAALLALFGICHSTPPSPPSPSAGVSSEPFFSGVRQIIKLPQFWVLCTCFGIGLGSVTAVTTLIQQILCPNGYSDKFSGMCGALFIVFGVFLSAILSFVVDKWKIFDEVAKVCWCLAALSFVLFVELSRLSGLSKFIAVVISLAGMFAFPLFPLTLELGIESTYPVAEATSSTCLIMFGQVFGIVIILAMQALTKDMPPHYEFAHMNCNPGNNSTAPNLDYTTSNLTLIGILTLGAVLFVLSYRCDYRRVNAEVKLAAERILSFSSSYPQTHTIQQARVTLQLPDDD